MAKLSDTEKLYQMAVDALFSSDDFETVGEVRRRLLNGVSAQTQEAVRAKVLENRKGYAQPVDPETITTSDIAKA